MVQVVTDLCRLFDFLFLLCVTLASDCHWVELLSTHLFPTIPPFHSMSVAKRSECVGLSACVKHGHVVQSKYCKWLTFDYVHPSIQS